VILSEAPYLRVIDIPSYTDCESNRRPVTKSSDISVIRTGQDQTDLYDLYTEHFSQRMTDRCPYTKQGKLTTTKWVGLLYYT